MKHKYVFYYYPKYPEKRGKFAFFPRVREGKERARRFCLEFDYYKIY